MLYIPCFNFNLLLFKKLIKGISCVLTFDSIQCKIKDKNFFKMIGSTNIHDGLYILKMSSYQTFFTDLDPLSIHHSYWFSLYRY